MDLKGYSSLTVSSMGEGRFWLEYIGSGKLSFGYSIPSFASLSQKEIKGRVVEEIRAAKKAGLVVTGTDELTRAWVASA